MDLFKNILDKYKILIGQQVIIIDKIQEIIYQTINIKLQPNQIVYKNKKISLKTSPLIRGEVLINKNNIIKKINDFFNDIIVIDIN